MKSLNLGAKLKNIANCEVVVKTVVNQDENGGNYSGLTGIFENYYILYVEVGYFPDELLFVSIILCEC